MGKFKRKRQRQVLTEEDLAYLEKNTRYNTDEIKEWFRFEKYNLWSRSNLILYFRGFVEVCPSGNLDKEGIMSIYTMPRNEAQVFIDQMFLMFDKDGNGTVNFKVRLDKARLMV